MTYDFDELIERKGTNSLKYDFTSERGKPDDVLSLWVADMDFPSPPEVIRALEEKVSHGIFGYSDAAGDDYFRALSAWYSGRFSWRISL
jgi:cystathionine beta-lyase